MVYNIQSCHFLCCSRHNACAFDIQEGSRRPTHINNETLGSWQQQERIEAVLAAAVAAALHMLRLLRGGAEAVWA